MGIDMMLEFAELFVTDGEWTDVLGQHVQGKEQIEKLHETRSIQF